MQAQRLRAYMHYHNDRQHHRWDGRKIDVPPSSRGSHGWHHGTRTMDMEEAAMQTTYRDPRLGVSRPKRHNSGVLGSDSNMQVRVFVRGDS